ncbi:MAG TPA: hypothetical protein VFV93_05960 [Thermomicrobiales bacterium]|nr:hypothetical protein [Thermomicrobiales bacterium]
MGRCRWTIAVATLLLVFPLLAACGDAESDGALADVAATPSEPVSSPTETVATTASQTAPSASPTIVASASPDDEMTPVDFFELIDAALAGTDGILHTRVTYTTFYQGQEAPIWTDESWIDAGRGVARREFQLAPDSSLDMSENMTYIVVGDTSYSINNDLATDGSYPDVDTTSVQTECATIETQVLVAFLVCGLYPFQPSEPQLSVEPNVEYEGQAALALLYEMATAPSSDPAPRATPEPRPERVEARLFIARETSLPLAWVVDWNDAGGETLGSQVARFASEPVAAESLPADFFDPTSIGYSDDPMAPIDWADLDIPILWLGERFEPGGDLPLLVLQYAEPQAKGQPDWASAHLQYYSADYSDDHLADTFVDMLLWTPEAWQRYSDELPGWMPFKSICAERRELPVESGGTAVIILTHEMEESSVPQPQSTPVEPTPVADRPGCPDAPYDRFAAIVTYDDVVVTVNVLDCLYCGPRPYKDDAYDTVPGLEAIVNGLRRY